ncbi:YkgJ family cysteine cluster protein [Delftia tsuruhatensis]|nr:YkgJ family cysteine cluster protein [Delftia tsuruhatensis]
MAAKIYKADSPRNAQRIVDEDIVAVARVLSTVVTGKLQSIIIPIFRDMDAELAASPVSIDCQSGCHYCCHYHVTVSAAEAFAIAEHLRAIPGGTGASLLAKLAATAERVAHLTEAQYLVTNIPCAFLDGGHCTIYEVRPLACRGHHAMRVDVCQRTFEDPTSHELSTLDAVRQQVHVGYKSALQFGEHLAGLDATLYELHGAVKEAVENSASFRRWKSGKVAFPSVRDRVSLAEALRV